MGTTNTCLLTESSSWFLKGSWFNELCCPQTTCRGGGPVSVAVNTCLHVGAGLIKQSQHMIRLERAFFV